MKGTTDTCRGEDRLRVARFEWAAKRMQEAPAVCSRSFDDGHVRAFNDSYGTAFTQEGFLRLQRVIREILDEDMREMILDTPEHVVIGEFSKALMGGQIRLFQRDNKMRGAVLTDTGPRDLAIRHVVRTAALRVREVGERKSA